MAEMIEAGVWSPAKPEDPIPLMEARYIGALLAFPALVLDVPHLSGAHFSVKEFGAAFEAIRTRVDLGQTVTPFGIVRDLGGVIQPAYALRLVADASAVDGGACAEDIFRVGSMRRITSAASCGDLGEVARLTTELQWAERPTAKGMTDHAAAVVADLRDAADGKRKAISAPSGVLDLDQMTGGLCAGDLVIVAGRPAMGKSTMAGRVALAAASAGHPVRFYSLEMSVGQVLQRMASDVLWDHGERIPYNTARSGKVTHPTVARIKDAFAEITSLPIEIIEGSKTVAGIKADCGGWFERKARETGKSGVLIVDYLGLVQPEDRYKGNRVQEVSQVSAAGKAMAQDLGVCSVFLSQLSRAVESRDDKRPHLADLRDSGSIEQDADSVVFCYRDAYYLARDLEAEPDPAKKVEMFNRLEAVKNEMELIVAKNRHGATGTVRAFCEIEYGAVRDLVRPGEADRWA